MKSELKKVLALVLAVMMIFTVAACSSSNSSTPSSAPVSAEPSETDDTVYKITISHQYATTTAFHDMVVWWKEQLETRSNGRIVVDEYPSAQLMPADQEFSAMLDGRITGNTCNSALMASFDENFSIFEMPFLFGNSYESLDYIKDYFQNDTVKNVLLGTLEEKGVKCYPTYLDGAREISTVTSPVYKLDDLKGLKMRTTGGRFSETTASVFGFSGIAIAAAELPTALMQGTVDGQMMNPVYVYQVKSPVKYYTIIPFDYTAVDPINISMDFYNSLPEDLQELMDTVGEELFDYSVEYTRDLLDYSYEMIADDMKVEISELSAEDYARAREMATQVWSAFEERIANGPLLIEAAKEVVGIIN